jgi:hypothetical protein
MRVTHQEYVVANGGIAADLATRKTGEDPQVQVSSSPRPPGAIELLTEQVHAADEGGGVDMPCEQMHAAVDYRQCHGRLQVDYMSF